MANQNIIKSLIFIENVLGIYRNYTFLSNRVKQIVKYRLAIDIGILIFIFFHSIKIGIEIYEAKRPLPSIILFGYCMLSAIINSSSAIVFGYAFSNHYETLVTNLCEIRKLAENDKLYVTITSKQHRTYKIRMISLAVVVTIWRLLKLNDSLARLMIDKIAIFMFIMSLILEGRYFVESVVFYELSEIIIVQLKYLNESISGVEKELSKERDKVEERRRNLKRVQEELERWGNINQLIAAACDRLRDCLGIQITMSFVWASLLYIGLLYSVIHYFITQVFLWGASVWNFSLTIILYFLVKFMILVSGQKAMYEADAVETKLVRLHAVLVSFSEPTSHSCARSLRSLLRRMRSTPVRVRTHDALPARATVLVTILGVVVTYTIVLLQFNHVL